MNSQARRRDQQAIDDAVNGWWSKSMMTHEQRIQWWRDAKFGMFIHWGIYSLPGGEWKGHKVNGYAEHLMRKEQITREEYLEVAHQFNPTGFDADAWVKAAKYAGMNYLVITAKHHDGFAMYPSEVSDFNIMKQTPWRHDPMADLAAACWKYGVRFGFYYSHAFDWEHPEAPGNDWEHNNPGGDKNLFGGADWYDEHPELLPRAIDYVDTKAIPQIRELIQKYHPDILWFDTPAKLPLSENIRILKEIREIDPDVVVNGRLARDAHFNFGDYKNTADRPAEFYPVEGDWEAIPTTNESYGYSKFDSSHKSPVFFIRLLAKATARGGNLLMNIGPMGNGVFDVRDSLVLRRIGDWVQRNRAAIYRTHPSGLPRQNWGETTAAGDTLYLHVFDWPKDGSLYLGGFEGKVRKAWLLADPGQKALKCERTREGDLRIRVPVNAPDPANTVIALRVERVQTTNNMTDTATYIAPNAVQARLLAYDARLKGGSFGFGDGKTDRYYVDGWRSTGQSLSWEFRTSEAKTVQVALKYLAGGNAGGELRLKLEGEEKLVEIGTGSGALRLVVVSFQLPAGRHTLELRAERINKEELMKLLEVQLDLSDKLKDRLK